MEIDPEVAELLNDLPRTELPQVLRDEGWGQFTMRQMGHSKHRSEVQQPTFTDRCVQCGRPITTQARNGRWTDHAGRRDCTNVLLDNPMSENHITEKDREGILVLREHVQRRVDYEAELRKLRDAFKDRQPVPTMKCSMTKHRFVASHTCTCPHPEGHFGFHECIICRHLWR